MSYRFLTIRIPIRDLLKLHFSVSLEFVKCYFMNKWGKIYKHQSEDKGLNLVNLQSESAPYSGQTSEATGRGEVGVSPSVYVFQQP